MGTVKIGGVIPTPLRGQIFTREDLRRLEGLGEVRWTDSAQALSMAEAVAILDGCAVGIGSWGTPWPDAELLAGCPELQLWIHAAGSVRHFFGPHLEARDLVIACCAPAIA